MPSRSLVLFVALALSSAACANIQHAAPPEPPASGSAADECRFESTLFARPARADVQIAQGSAVSYTFGSPTWYTSPTYHASAGGPAAESASGLDFYLGARRLPPREGLVRLGDDELVAKYDAALERYSAGRHAAWARPAWIGLLGGGMALVGVGLGAMFTAERDPETNTPEYGPALVMLSGSALAMLASIPFVWLDLGYQEEAAQRTIREAIYVPDGQAAADRVAALLDAHNTRAESATCE